jgi:hypothetical protein
MTQLDHGVWLGACPVRCPTWRSPVPTCQRQDSQTALVAAGVPEDAHRAQAHHHQASVARPEAVAFTSLIQGE